MRNLMGLKKLLADISLFLPGKRVFFIYSHNNASDRFVNGLTANTEISHWSIQALKREFPRVTFLRLQGEKSLRLQRISEKDVVIGHIGETFQKASERTKRMIAFYPWTGHLDRNQSKKFNCIEIEKEMISLKAAKSIIFLTSEYNVQKYMNSQSNFWYSFCQEYPVRYVHQPLDLHQFKRVKFSYETSNFLYIGNDAHMKCLDHSRSLVQAVDRELSIYGLGKRKLGNLDSKAVAELSTEADFFIQPGMWECQCVSILEAAARGFIPVVSRETGYPYEHPFLLRYNDFEFNKLVLKDLLHSTPGDRKNLADSLHSQLENDVNHNNWGKLTSVLVDEVKKLYQ
ncbi:MAG: glycosyltransferase involved in cell wall biosynthesis [Chlamydiales bacterium]|jgi:glycosyltransferase involved in cell wall biosynthesis